MIYGYARVSTHGQEKDGNSLEAQTQILKEKGAEKIFSEAYTGTKCDRPEFQKLLNEIKDGDTLIVTKLDRFARSTKQGLDLIDSLLEKNVTVNIVNMGVINNTPTGKLIRTIFFAFAEFERGMIVERTQEGKNIAKKNPNWKDGRPRKFSSEQIELALNLLENNSYTQVEKMTGISKSSLQRAKRKSKRF